MEGLGSTFLIHFFGIFKQDFYYRLNFHLSQTSTVFTKREQSATAPHKRCMCTLPRRRMFPRWLSECFPVDVALWKPHNGVAPTRVWCRFVENLRILVPSVLGKGSALRGRRRMISELRFLHVHVVTLDRTCRLPYGFEKGRVATVWHSSSASLVN